VSSYAFLGFGDTKIQLCPVPARLDYSSPPSLFPVLTTQTSILTQSDSLASYTSPGIPLSRTRVVLRRRSRTTYGSCYGRCQLSTPAAAGRGTVAALHLRLVFVVPLPASVAGGSARAMLPGHAPGAPA
jgi:hypothetical protein